MTTASLELLMSLL
uniref:Uncharacterized protein n=1 Tax=Arundo donax TaxID=35708 RepID=A0A0A9BPZ5_ARUDO